MIGRRAFANALALGPPGAPTLSQGQPGQSESGQGLPIRSSQYAG